MPAIFKPIEILYAGLLLTAALVFWWLLERGFSILILGNGALAHAIALLAALVLAFCATLALFGLGAMVFESKKGRLLLAAAAAAGVLLFSGVNLLVAGVFGLILLVLLNWARSVRADAQNRIKPSLIGSLNAGLRLSLTLLALAVAILLYSQLLDQGKQVRAIKGLVNMEMIFLHQGLALVTPDYDPQDPPGRFLAKFIEGPVGGRLIGLPPDSVSTVSPNQLAAALELNLSRRLGIDLAAFPSLDQAGRALLNKNVNVIFERYNQLFPFGLAFILFLLIKLLTPLYRLLIHLLAWLLAGLLRSVRVLQWRESAASVRRLGWAARPAAASSETRRPETGSKNG